MDLVYLNEYFGEALLKTFFGYDSYFTLHETGAHPEQPARLPTILTEMEKQAFYEELIPVKKRVEPGHWIQLCHDDAYIQRLKNACEMGRPAIDCPDSVICPESYDVARQAVAMTLAGCDMIMNQQADNGFCALRPPGHHAEADRSMGFCLFNNIAIAARYLQQNYKLQRILVLDWDVHHGNGTQHIFEKEAEVFYCSLHQHPATLYPGTGWPEEKGTGKGIGATMNLVFEPGCTDGQWIDQFKKHFIPAAMEFSPEFILVSAGFDAHKSDPLAQLNLTEEAFIRASSEIKSVAKECAQGKMISLLEGGYDLEALGSCVKEHVKTLLV